MPRLGLFVRLAPPVDESAASDFVRLSGCSAAESACSPVKAWMYLQRPHGRVKVTKDQAQRLKNGPAAQRRRRRRWCWCTALDLLWNQACKALLRLDLVGKDLVQEFQPTATTLNATTAEERLRQVSASEVQLPRRLCGAQTLGHELANASCFVQFRCGSVARRQLRCLVQPFHSGGGGKR